IRPFGGVLGLTPDGKRIMCTAGYGDGVQPGDVALFSFETGKEVARIKPGIVGGIKESAFSPSGRIAAIGGKGVCWLWTINAGQGPVQSRQGQRPEPAVVRWTEGKIRDVIAGGGGRYLALTLAEARKVAIFDSNAAGIVKTIPLASDDALLAAGATKLVIAYPREK